MLTMQMKNGSGSTKVMQMLTTSGGTKTIIWDFWNGQRLQGTRQCPIGFDTETEMITDDRVVPQLALAVASDGRNHVVIHPDQLGAFLQRHQDSYLVGHNVQFDFWVVDQHLQHGQQGAGRVLWNMVDRGRVFDTQILDLLLQLATGKFRHVPGGKDTELKVYPGNLADVAADYTSLVVSKDDPYRKRFGELIGLSPARLETADRGFFDYAVADAYATRQLYPALSHAAKELMTQFDFDRKAQRYDIRPDALDRFGYLSDVIQVKASIVLSHMFRRGVRVDVGKATALRTKYRADMASLVAQMERDYRDVLTYEKDGTLRLTPKSQTPSLGQCKLEKQLILVAAEIRQSISDFKTPVSNGKKKGMALGAKDWAPYASLHPFLDLRRRMSKLEKLLGFLASLAHPVVHGEYTLLKRTGRTSCSKPRNPSVPGLNIQQMPKLPEFRALFIPDHGQELFVGDFSVAELRTLAAVCRAKLGSSKLGEIIKEGVDPHAFTAAAIQGMSLDQFMLLKGTDADRYKNGRQQAKAINFGVPGGMGAESLRAYAMANYGVTLSIGEAKTFREKLITEIYPELNANTGYLADTGTEALARNLGVTPREVWEVVDPSGQRKPIAARGFAKVVRGMSDASSWFQAKVWDSLDRLLRTISDADPEITELVARKEGGQRLHDLLYRQSAATLTGRLRAGVSYTDAKNTPFQSLAADGAKLALWNLLHAGFDPVAFVHDEILVQLPAENAEEQGKRVEQIMVKSMEEVMGQDIPAACDYVVADCWTKP